MSVLTADRKKALIALLATEGFMVADKCRSWVASYFVVNGAQQARCLLCAHDEKTYQIRFQTSNCAYHLQHAHAMSAPVEMSRTISGSSSNLPTLFERMKKNQAERKTLIAFAFADNRLSYKLLRNESFRQAFGVHMSEQTMKSEVRSLAAEVRSEVEKIVKSSYAACLMCDSTQADNTNGSWLNFCVVVGNQSYYYKGLLLTESLTGDRICAILKEIVEDIERGGRVTVVSFCSDNGANFVRGIESYIAQFRPWAFFVRCAAHSIQLIVKDAITQQIPDFMQQMSASLAPFRQQEVAKIFHAVQVIQPAITPLKIVKPIDVRWNSHYNAARRVLDRWNAYSSAIGGTSVANQFCSEEWKNKLTAFCTAMKPFACATDTVQAEAFQAISLWDVLAKAGREVTEIRDASQDSLKIQLCNAVINAYTARWSSNLNHSLLSTILAFLDPVKRRDLNIAGLEANAFRKTVDFCLGFALQKEDPPAAVLSRRRGEIKAQVERELAEYRMRSNAFGCLEEYENDFVSFWTLQLSIGMF
eukprot:ANDGO_07527.mRNA.1 hypothetical protein